ncbi:MAG: family 1 glycosylhydrolase, partial [bacterium]|nr:family 1 glycosylhydrolase [bacterium]
MSDNHSLLYEGENSPHHHETMWFPKGFLWGTATSSHQVEGNTTNNDWWAQALAGKTPLPGTGPDHYHRFTEDFDNASRLNQNAHRLSIEWSRIEPREGEFDEQEIQHYRDVIKALRERGLEPFVTLHHFTNPQWFAEAGGWESHRAVRWFSRYVQHVVEALGDDVRFWITINEPMVLAVQGYFFGVWPPNKRSWRTMIRVIVRLSRAHRKAYRIIHRIARKKRWSAQVGIAHNVSSFHA